MTRILDNMLPAVSILVISLLQYCYPTMVQVWTAEKKFKFFSPPFFSKTAEKKFKKISPPFSKNSRIFILFFFLLFFWEKRWRISFSAITLAHHRTIQVILEQEIMARVCLWRVVYRTNPIRPVEEMQVQMKLGDYSQGHKYSLRLILIYLHRFWHFLSGVTCQLYSWSDTESRIYKTCIYN